MKSLAATKDLERRSYRRNHRNTMSVPWTDDNRSEYESTLRISNASYLDTGYYVCHFKDARDMDDGRVTARVYIYVEGNCVVIRNCSPTRENIHTIFNK